MQIYLNQQRQPQLEAEYQNGAELLKALESESEIITEIQLNGVEINSHYLSQLDFSQQEEAQLEITVQKVSKLIKETLNTANDYLPKLKAGFQETIKRLRTLVDQQADQKLQPCIDGLEWYLEAIEKILNFVEDKELSQRTNKELDNLQAALQETLAAYQKEDRFQVAELLESKLLPLLDKFIEINQEILSTVNN